MSIAKTVVACVCLILSVCVSSWGSDVNRSSSSNWDLWADSGEPSVKDGREEETRVPVQVTVAPQKKPAPKVEETAVDRVRPTETRAAAGKTNNLAGGAADVSERRVSVKAPVPVKKAASTTDAVQQSETLPPTEVKEPTAARSRPAELFAVKQRTPVSTEVKGPAITSNRQAEPVKAQLPKTPVPAAVKEPAKEMPAGKTASSPASAPRQPLPAKEPPVEIQRSPIADAVQKAKAPVSSVAKETDSGNIARSSTVVAPQTKTAVSTETKPTGKKTESGKPEAGDMAGSVPVGIAADYLIGPGDILDISVWKDEALTRTVVVLPDGTINFPLIGKITVVGKTLEQVKAGLVKELLPYIPELELSIEVKQSNSMIVYIIGRVNAPGRQVLNSNVDVLQALSMAGGLTPFANRNKIKVFRKNGSKTDILPFRYNDVIDGKLATNVELKRGDVIVVP